jgi:AP-1 complex subunit sigma 1/2
LYTTKAAGSDKKLYKQIDRSLEAQHEAILRLAASLSPPQAAQFAKTSNLSQSSPFGTLSQISNRRTYAYMIATLNASHPDYDFSNVLRPADFCREKSLKNVMGTVDSKIYSAQSSRIPRGLQTPGGSLMWGPRMWNNIDAEMDLYSCEIYSYRPDENPFDDEETALWSLHYFFFNKAMKRVCYLNARALSPSFAGDDSDDNTVEDGTITPMRPKRRYEERQSADFSARKRARFWLGDRADDVEEPWDEYVEDESAEEDVDVELLDEIVKRGRSMSSNMSEDRDDVEDEKERAKSRVRRMSEAVAEAIEL